MTCPHLDIYGQMLHRCRVCGALYENGQWSMGTENDALKDVLAERDRLRDALAEVYFHLGPPQDRVTEHAEVPRLVEQAMVERDRLRAVVEAALEVVRPMADSACDADVLRIADLYRILAGPALDGSGEATDG